MFRGAGSRGPRYQTSTYLSIRVFHLEASGITGQRPDLFCRSRSLVGKKTWCAFVPFNNQSQAEMCLLRKASRVRFAGNGIPSYPLSQHRVIGRVLSFSFAAVMMMTALYCGLASGDDGKLGEWRTRCNNPETNTIMNRKRVSGLVIIIVE